MNKTVKNHQNQIILVKKLTKDTQGTINHMCNRKKLQPFN